MHILLILGGEGSEHDVSKMGAKNVLEAFSKTDFIVESCEIARDGTWSKSFDEISNGGFDAIFPLIHGKGGEDGAISAMGEILKIPVVGCDMRASQLAWDKDFCKIILSQNNIPVVPWRTFHEGEIISDFQKISDELDSKILFIKPAREGSSIGVSCATNEIEFRDAIKKAFEYDDKILIEKAIMGRELECSVLGNSPEISVTGIGEITPPKDTFYSYEEKYSDESRTGLDIPAQNLPDKICEKIQNFAKTAFIAIGGNGLSRIDFFYDENSGEIFLNEINTMPGFTNISMYPKLWENDGLSYDELLKKLVELAREKFTY